MGCTVVLLARVCGPFAHPTRVAKSTLVARILIAMAHSSATAFLPLIVLPGVVPERHPGTALGRPHARPRTRLGFPSKIPLQTCGKDGLTGTMRGFQKGFERKHLGSSGNGFNH